MVKKNIQVSIIIVNYNSFHLLRNCIESIYKYHTNLDFEVIVVDNASTEGKIENVLKKFTEVHLIKNESNLGFAAANNKGINLAKGDYVLFLNNDTVFFEDTILKVYNFAKSNKEKAFFGIRLLNPDKTYQRSVVSFDNLMYLFSENIFLYRLFPKSKLLNKYYQNYLDLKFPTEVDIISGAFMFCPREEMKAMQGFDERFFFYAEETDLCYRFKEIGGKVIFLPQISMIHMWGATSLKNIRFKFLNQSVAKIKFFQKHFRGLKFILAVFLHYLGLLIRIPFYVLRGLFAFNKFELVKAYWYLRCLFIYPPNEFSQFK